MQTIKKAVPKYDLFHSGGEKGIQDPSTTHGVVISIAAAMEKGSNQPPISGTKKAATSATLFVMSIGYKKDFNELIYITAYVVYNYCVEVPKMHVSIFVFCC